MIYYLYQKVEQPTHSHGNQTPNTLDLVFTNKDGMVDIVKMRSPLGKSHHALLSFTLTCYADQAKTIVMKYLCNKVNYDALREEFSKINWADTLANKTPDEQWLEIVQNYNRITKIDSLDR